MDASIKDTVLGALRDAGDGSPVQSVEPADKGGVSDTACVETRDGRYFVKWNRSPQFGLFRAEAQDLGLIRQTRSVRVPEVIAWADAADGTPGYMIQEWISMGSPAQQEGRLGSELGEKLAEMHHASAQNPPPGYGQHDHHQAVPGETVWHEDWIDFFVARLNGQIPDKVEKGLLFGERLRRYETLVERVPLYLKGVPLVPSLLHGDLHIGNVRAASNGQPVVFDPWAWYGDREWEVASTLPWGYFSSTFYEAYQAAYPLADGYEERLLIYKLNSLLWGYMHEPDSAAQIDEVLRRFVD